MAYQMTELIQKYIEEVFKHLLMSNICILDLNSAEMMFQSATFFAIGKQNHNYNLKRKCVNKNYTDLGNIAVLKIQKLK